MSIIAQAFTSIDSMLAPLIPQGVTGMQFLSVFLIVYAITFLTLSKIHLLKENKSAQLLIAIFIAYFTASSAFSVILISKLFPGLGVVSMMIIAFLTILSMLTPEKELKKIFWAPLMILLGIGFIAVTTWSSMSDSINLSGINLPQLGQSEWFTIIFLGVFVGVILLVSFSGRKGKEGEGKFGTKLIKALRGDESVWKD